MGDVTTEVVIPGAEFDASEHAGGDIDALLRVAAMFGVQVPLHNGHACGDESPSGWECSRAADHTGRHCAYLWTGAVVAVWHQHDW
jgi:hypothetical protein